MLDICYLDSPCLAAIYYKNDHPIQTMHKITNLFYISKISSFFYY